MGSGKSHIGKQLAQLLDYLFIDTDHLLENTEGSSIAQIFETKGEVAFRQLESDTLKGLSKWDNIVVATGGGAPCFYDNMTYINNSGISIYLKTDSNLLLQRLLPERDKRPLLRGRTEPELLDFIKNKVAERETFYIQAHIIIEQNENSDDIVFDILQKILNHRIAN